MDGFRCLYADTVSIEIYIIGRGFVFELVLPMKKLLLYLLMFHRFILEMLPFFFIKHISFYISISHNASAKYEITFSMDHVFIKY